MVSSYFKVAYILFIYLVGRACIPGIFGWFVLPFFSFLEGNEGEGLYNYFFPFGKETRHPWRGALLLRDKPTCGPLPRIRLALGSIKLFIEPQTG